MKYTELVTELYDANAAFELEWNDTFGPEERSARARDSRGGFIDIKFIPVANDIVEVEFSRNDSYDVTGEGEASRVLATVLEAFRDYLRGYQPKILIFASKGQSRTKLYQSLINRFARSVGYQQFDINKLKPETREKISMSGSDVMVLRKTAVAESTKDSGDTMRYNNIIPENFDKNAYDQEDYFVVRKQSERDIENNTPSKFWDQVSRHDSLGDAQQTIEKLRQQSPNDKFSYTMHRRTQGVAEGSELKQAKRKYNQAAKDANLDQVGAGKKIDTMKKSLRQKDLGKEQGVAESSLKEFAPGGNSASSYYAVTANFVNEFAQQKQQELQDLIDAGWTKQDLVQAGTLKGHASDIAHFEQVRDRFLKGLKSGFDAYLQGDTQLKDQLGEYWMENDLPLNQDWEKIYGEPWGDKGVAEAGPFSYGAKKPKKGSVADLAAQKRKEQERGKRPVEPRDQMVGTARVTKDVAENAEELNIGDDVIITGNVQFQGKTGMIVDFGDMKRFVVVDLYNHGKHSFHSSDVSFNDYADSDDERRDSMSEARANTAGVRAGLAKRKTTAPLSPEEQIAKDRAKFEKWKAKNQKPEKDTTTGVSEDAAGVGVIASKKQKNDPRYSMSLTKDVRPGEDKRNMKKLHLEGYGRNRGYSHGFASPTAPSLGRRGREDDEYVNGPDPVDTATWYIRANGKIIKDKMGTPFQFRGKEAARKAALTMMAKPFNAGKKFVLTTRPEDEPPVAEAGKGISKDAETKFHAKLDQLVHDTFGKRKSEKK